MVQDQELLHFHLCLHQMAQVLHHLHQPESRWSSNFSSLLENRWTRNSLITTNKPNSRWPKDSVIPPTREQKAQILLISTYQNTRDLCVTCSPLSLEVASMWRNIPISVTFLLSSMLALDRNASPSASRKVPGMWGSTHLQLQFHLRVWKRIIPMLTLENH